MTGYGQNGMSFFGGEISEVVPTLTAKDAVRTSALSTFYWHPAYVFHLCDTEPPENVQSAVELSFGEATCVFPAPLPELTPARIRLEDKVGATQ